MIERRIVRRYASALFHAALEARVVDQIESDLGMVAYTLESSPTLMEVFTSPVVPAEKKRGILRDLFADKVHEITLSYLFLLVDKRREEAVLQTEEEFIALANEVRGIVAAQVTTAVPLTEEEQARLTKKLAAITGKSIQLSQVVDPELIGGATVKIGDTVIDGSIQGQLAALKERLLS